MSKIEIKDLYLVFGNEKQKALKMLKEGKTKSEILKATGCTVAVKDANLSINEGEIFVIMGLSGSGKSTLPFDTPYFRRSDYQWNRHSQSVG